MRGRNTVIMAIVAALLGAAVYFLEIRGSAEREAAEAVADRLLQFTTEDVRALTITDADGTIALARTDDTWRITAPHQLAADQTAVDGIVNRLQSADQERLVEEAPDDLGRFGLAEPGLTVSLELADGTHHELAFGDGTPVGFNVFVKRGDGEAVYIAAASIKDAVGKSLFDLRDRKVMAFTDADVARVEIEGEALTATVERQPDRGDGIDRWALSAPLAAPADAQTVSGLLQRLRTSNAVAFAADEPTDEQIAEFGLDRPSVTVRLWTGDDAAHTLLIGGEATEPAGRYARRAGSDAIMVVPANLVSGLPASVTALRNRTVVEFARDRVNGIALDNGDDGVRLEKDGADWHIRAPRALDGDAGAVSSLLTAALGLRARAFPEGDPDGARFGFGDPHRRVSFALEALPGEASEEGQPAETVTLLVGAATEVDAAAGPADEGSEDAAPEPGRYVRVEGLPAVFAVAEADLDDLDVDLFTLRSKTLVSFAQSDLTRLEVTTAGATLTLDKNDDGAWTHDGEPVDDTVSSAVDDLLWRLNYLDMQGIVAEPAAGETIDTGPYGLSSPLLRVRALIGDAAAGAVSVGAPVPEDSLQDLPQFAPQTQTYAAVDGQPGVYRIDAALRDAAQTLLEALS